jgi:hypothetical protein
MPTLAAAALGESNSNITVREALMYATLFRDSFSSSIML